MSNEIIDEWIVNKVKVTVVTKANCFDGFNNTAYIHTAGTIKKYDDVGILFENKMKDAFYIPYTSIIEIERLKTGKDEL